MYPESAQSYLPAASDTYRALLRVGAVLGVEVCWLYGRRYFFRLRRGDLIAVTSESGRRLRITRLEGARETRTMWTLADDLDRLTDLVAELSDESVRQGA